MGGQPNLRGPVELEAIAPGLVFGQYHALSDHGPLATSILSADPTTCAAARPRARSFCRQLIGDARAAEITSGVTNSSYVSEPYDYPGGWKPIRYEQRCRDRRTLLNAALERAKMTCGRCPDVVRLIVFGSFARGDVSAWSDLDLLVVADRNAGAAVDAINSAAIHAEVLGMTASDAQQRLSSTPLGRTIAREGIVAYER